MENFKELVLKRYAETKQNWFCNDKKNTRNLNAAISWESTKEDFSV